MLETVAGTAGRIPQGIFGFSFWSWQGNQASYEQSQWLSYLLIVGAFFTLGSFFFFRTQLTSFYHRHTRTVLISFQAYSGLLLVLSAFRAILLGMGNYPNLWEIIPLHFCRLFVVVMAAALLVRKTTCIKYGGFFAILGAIFGLMLTDLKNSPFWIERGGIAIGYDSYLFWDFLIIHISSMLIPGYFLTINQFCYSKRTVLGAAVGLIGLTIVIFGLDWGLSYAADPRWRANWFYLAPDEYNSVYAMLATLVGPLARWPWILLGFIMLGLILYALCFLIYFWLNRFHFIIDRASKRIRLVSQEPQLWYHFKATRFF